MHINTKIEKSVYYHIKDIFSTYPSITVVDEFPDIDLDLPTISVERVYTSSAQHELGNRKGRFSFLWSVNVFASNRVQRDEFASLIFDNLDGEKINVYDYSEGFPPDVTPTVVGSLEIEGVSSEPVRIFPELVEKLYWRESLKFYTVYNPV